MKEMVEITVSAELSVQEILVAHLTDFPFEGFEQRDQSILAFMPSEHWDDKNRQLLLAVLRKFNLRDTIEERLIPDQNWNRKWEESIRPIHVGGFCIRPTWSEEEAVAVGEVELLVDPKMSFGTGHHESTRLMLVMLPEFILPGSLVLDAGTGTGILAIAAVKQGAGRVVGFDIDPWSQENARENSELNHVADQVDIRSGPFEVVPERDFSVILANINLSALIKYLPDFNSRLTRRGTLLISGILTKDRPAMIKAMSSEGFQVIREVYEGEWWAAASRIMEY